ncbi:MAG: deoxyribodipyrimidine photolyase [Sandaracinaceae bacterium]
MAVPQLRLRRLGSSPVRSGGAYVLYWMTAARRTEWNYALDHALDWCRELDVPLVVLEPLRVAYPHACDRFHRFVIDGMADQAASFAAAGVTYLPYVEPTAGAGRGLLLRLASRACVVVADDYPTFFLPRMLQSAADQLDVALDAVDANGIVPMRRPDKEHVTARGYRRWMQGIINEELARAPERAPLSKAPSGTPGLPDLSAWPMRSEDELRAPASWIGELPIDHTVSWTEERGGAAAGHARWAHFLDSDLDRYATDSNHPDKHATSEISPYLHFGHVAAHALFFDLAAHEGWSPGDQSKPNGKNAGYWNMRPGAEGFLEQLLVWRELAFATCAIRPDHADWSVLPEWARRTLTEHADDPRDPCYDLATLERAETYDDLWNAAQRQLVETGRIHNYLRMLWGKKILEWSPSPQVALEWMILLNDRYALDGRDPNSYSGITWVLGHFDRGWGPKRPIYGSIRYMTSGSAKRKLRLKGYLARWSPS